MTAKPCIRISVLKRFIMVAKETFSIGRRVKPSAPVFATGHKPPKAIRIANVLPCKVFTSL